MDGCKNCESQLVLLVFVLSEVSPEEHEGTSHRERRWSDRQEGTRVERGSPRTQSVRVVLVPLFRLMSQDNVTSAT